MIDSNLEATPAELRSIFGQNLRVLARKYPSIASLCRKLGINRTQFNRYLSSESFPRPDVLHRICKFFDVDARILLEPVNDISRGTGALLAHPEVANFLGQQSTQLSEEDFPSGFYRFWRPSFVNAGKFVLGMVYIYRKDGFTFLRGYEPKEAMRQQGLSTSLTNREFRGVLMRQEQGIAAIVARSGALTCSFNFLSRVTSYENNFWEGYATRTVREGLDGSRAARMVYEHIQGNTSAILDTARKAGFASRDDVPPFHMRLLRADAPFQ